MGATKIKATHEKQAASPNVIRVRRYADGYRTNRVLQSEYDAIKPMTM